MTGRNKFAEVGDFVTMKDSSFAVHGVQKGDLLYVAGDTVVSVDESDPYQLRRLLICAYTEGEHVAVEKQPFMVDGKRLKKVSKKKQESLNEIFQTDFGEEENPEVVMEEKKGETTH